MGKNHASVVEVDFGQTAQSNTNPMAIDDRQIIVQGDLYILEGDANPNEWIGTNTQTRKHTGSVDENAEFRLTVDVDREMERSVLYRVLIMLELIGFALLLRSVALHFLV